MKSQRISRLNLIKYYYDYCPPFMCVRTAVPAQHNCEHVIRSTFIRILHILSQSIDVNCDVWPVDADPCSYYLLIRTIIASRPFSQAVIIGHNCSYRSCVLRLRTYCSWSICNIPLSRCFAQIPNLKLLL
jgi:hypothetical protein